MVAGLSGIYKRQIRASDYVVLSKSQKEANTAMQKDSSNRVLSGTIVDGGMEDTSAPPKTLHLLIAVVGGS